nr:hypothetical protein [uncultured Roseateles sp.]
MSAFIDTCEIWVVVYRLDGRDRQWVRALPPMAEAQVRALLLEELDELYGTRSGLVSLRQAEDAERATLMAGGLPMCPVATPPEPSAD